MNNNLDDLDFTKLGEKFDEKRVEESALLADDHDDGHDDLHGDHHDSHDDYILPILELN
jgi:hypothetical protein